MNGDVDISLVLTAHREGLLSGVSARSLMQARAAAERDGLRCEVIVVLDNADDLTAQTLREALGEGATFFETELGDPGQARNFGISQAEGQYSTFLDADDLWSRNWLVKAVALSRERPDAIVHSACNVFFGNVGGVWWHVDSESPLCDPGYLQWMNYWDAMTLAKTELFRRYPFRKNEIGQGFGHEDWHWNIVTLSAGVPHKPATGTVHFKRRRRGTQSGKVDTARGMPFPEPGAVPDRTEFVRMLAGVGRT